MAEPKANELMEKIVSLCKRRGFVFQSSEIYGGINGFWDYGPLGAELKRNVKDLWWHAMTRQRDDVSGLEATIIMSPQIWKASGHVDTFADLMVECPVTKKRFRADQIEPQSGIVYHFSGAYDGSKFNPLLNQYPQEMRNAVEAKVQSLVLEYKQHLEGTKKTVEESVEDFTHTFQKHIVAFEEEYYQSGCPTFQELFRASLVG